MSKKGNRVGKMVDELERELRMRRGVWKMADRKNERFVCPKHQNQYDALKYALAVIKCLSDKECVKLLNRKIESEMQSKAQIVINF